MTRSESQVRHSNYASSSFLSYSRAHPWLLLEHVAFLVLFLHYLLSAQSLSTFSFGNFAALGSKACFCEEHREGPFSNLKHEAVSKAPEATLDIADLPDGEAVSYHDNRGNIFRFKIAPGVLINLMTSKQGTLRSGDLHNCTQFDLLLKGRARLHTRDLETNRDTLREYVANELITIPARVPHLFEFVEESFIVEWWTCEFQAWYYKPFREVIEASGGAGMR